MLRGTVRTLRYARSWTTGAPVELEETFIDRDGELVPATLVLPGGHSGPLPGWIALGGVTRMGRFHPQLVRFAGALAASGAAVLIPEVPEWRRLEVTPRPVPSTVRGAMTLLCGRREVAEGKVGLIGFSFGAPQVALAAAHAELSPAIAGAVLFGGYCSLAHTTRCMFTGGHEWNGVRHELEPDPYGRWVVGSNHLTGVPGHEDAGDVAEALHCLASAASEERIPAWDVRHDDRIAALRQGLPAERRGLFDLFAVASTATPPEHEARLDLADRLVAACIRAEPLLEPSTHLPGVRVPTRLVHGRGDRLIPFTECLRMADGLSPDVRAGHTVTGLFSHTADRAEGSPLGRTLEKLAFFETLRGIINTVPVGRASVRR